MNFEIKKVATAGVEIKNEYGEIIGWSIDRTWGSIIAEAMKEWFEKYEEAA